MVGINTLHNYIANIKFTQGIITYAPAGTVTGTGSITLTPLPPPKLSSSSSSVNPPPAANQNPSRITTGKNGKTTAQIGLTASVADTSSPICFGLRIKYTSNYLVLLRFRIKIFLGSERTYEQQDYEDIDYEIL